MTGRGIDRSCRRGCGRLSRMSLGSEPAKRDAPMHIIAIRTFQPYVENVRK